MADKNTVSAKLAKRLGKRITQRRKDIGWTQDELAERVRVDAETISRFERGANLPSLPTLESLAVALNIGIGELLAKTESPRIDDLSVIATLLNGLHDSDRAFIIDELHRWCEQLRRH